MDGLTRQLDWLWEKTADVWLSGGWAMVAIAIIALVMFAVGLNAHLQLRSKGFLSVREETWRGWLERPDEREGPIGDLLDAVSGCSSLDENGVRFRELRDTETVPFERDLRVMKVCVSAAPLLGLLGTVTGMLSTFEALASGSGGDETMRLVARGISEALITTETGLVIALPGLFLHYQLVRKLERYKAFLAHLETVCAQRIYRLGREDARRVARLAARQRIATALRDGLRRIEPPENAANDAGPRTVPVVPVARRREGHPHVSGGQIHLEASN